MDSTLYPWNGEFVPGDPQAPVAVVTLANDLKLPLNKVAIHGKMKTENLGIEKVVANVISNPNIRFVIIFGEEIRGHRAGGSLHALHSYGLDDMRKIRNAPGAVPYIENLTDEAIARFRDQVSIIDLLNETDMTNLMESIEQCIEQDPGNYGEPFIAIRMKSEATGARVLPDSLALHNFLMVSPFLEISNLDHRDRGIDLHSSLRMTIHGRVESAG